LLAGSVLVATSAFAGQPVLVDGNGRPIAVVTGYQLQQQWNAYVKVHGLKRGGVIYTPYSAKFGRGGIHCDDTGSNVSPSCDLPDTTIYGGD
jgi:hypothetical protein